MLRLNQEHRNTAIGMLINGASIGTVAHRNANSRLQARFHQSGTVCDRQRSGRSCVTIPAQDLYIYSLHLRKGFRNAALA